MPDFTVNRYGTDTSGRPIYMTAYMAAWLDAVRADPLVAPFASKIVVTQGAFMARNGGGAPQSAGYHDAAGCIDFRSWNLTAGEIDAFIKACRKRGGAASHRLPSDGFAEEHIHCTLGGDHPYTSGAADSWAQYVAGTNGLKNRAADREWRPNPLVLSFVPAKPKHLPLRVYFANLDWSTGRGKDREHLAHLADHADVMLLVEAKNIDVGKLLPEGWVCNQDRSSADRAGSVVAWREDVFTKRRRSLRQIAPRIVPTVEDAGMLTRFANVQTLKVKVTGETYRFVAAHYAPKRYAQTWPLTTRALRRIRRRPLLPPVVIGVDANQPVDELADDLRLIDYGRGIVGVMVAGKRVRVTEGPIVDHFGQSNEFTDHPDIGAVLERK